MKTTACKRYNRFCAPPAYPNAATRQEIIHKVLDLLLVAASGMGLAAILLLYIAIA
ncbi:MAG: hypothetical protein IJA74_02975 [Oscillospiraceae bacterium]|nr:hypothetical protein [Oscillospiraceae bacterium]